MNNLQVIEQREVLGRDFKIYGDIENPLFLAKDVANWTEHSNTSKMLNSIDEDEKVKAILPITNSYTQAIHGGARENTEVWFLTEDGLYEVLMLSRKQIAKDFKKKVKEILKGLRKGELKIVASYQIEDPIERAKAWIREHEERRILAQTIEVQAPKVEYHDMVLHSEKLISTTDVAKDLGMSAQKLNNKLHELGVIYKKGKIWKLYSKHENKIPEYCDYHINKFSQSLKWTEIRRKWIIELLNEV